MEKPAGNASVENIRMKPAPGGRKEAAQELRQLVNTNFKDREWEIEISYGR